MHTAAASSTKSDTKSAVREAVEILKDRLGDTPNWIVAQATVTHDQDVLRDELCGAFPNVPIHGGTSCMGVLTQEGFHSEDGVGLGLFGVVDPKGAYGVGAVSQGSDPHKAGADAVRKALQATGRQAEVPTLLWVGGAPGNEETVLSGIESVVGVKVPIVGGSTADNTVEGHWKQFVREEVLEDAVVVSALFPSTAMFSNFQSGYTPTDLKGSATKTSGRVIHTIDGRPAAVVYNEWIGGKIEDALEGGANVLARTTLNPLGRRVGDVGGVPYYMLAHPDGVTADQALTLFAAIEEGEELILMQGTTEGLVKRAGEVAHEVLELAGVGAGDVAGCLVIFCAGCMLTVQEDMSRVSAKIREVLGEVPVLGCFTFGEQGCFVGGENRQGNLMISVTALLKE